MVSGEKRGDYWKSSLFHYPDNLIVRWGIEMGEHRTKLSMKNISIEFPGVKALSNVDFELETGKIHALIGANGAGKSTLMKVLAGAYDHYTGQILFNGEEVTIRTPRDAKKLGVDIVYQ